MTNKSERKELREYLRVKETAAYLGCSVPTVWRKMRDDPAFPKSIKLSERVTVWKLSELESWISSLRGK